MGNDKSKILQSMFRKMENNSEINPDLPIKYLKNYKNKVNKFTFIYTKLHIKIQNVKT